jgi:DNA repair protein RadC
MQQPDLFETAQAAVRLTRRVQAWELAEDQQILAATIEPFAGGGNSGNVSQGLLARFGSYRAVLTADPAELMAVFGMTFEAANAIKLAQASVLRLLQHDARAGTMLSAWPKLLAYLTAAMGSEPREQFRVLHLDTRNRLLADEKMNEGTVNHVPCYPREIVRRALAVHATAMVLAHNHPSGDPTPSREDIAMTREIKAAADALRIKVHDHVIIARERWLSFAQEGLL